MTSTLDKENQIQELTQIALQLSDQAKNSEEIEVSISQGSEVEISIYEQDVENMSMASSTAIGVRVIDNHREGRAWTESLEPESLQNALENARLNAMIAEPDEFVTLVKPQDIDDVEPVIKNGFNDSVITTPLEDKIELAKLLERRARQYNEKIKDVPNADYGDSWGHSVVANSNGIVVSNSTTSAGASVVMMLGETDSQESSGFSYGRGYENIDLDEILEMAFTRGARLLNGTQPISAKVPVIFDPLVTSQMLGIFSSMMSGSAVAKSRALLADRLEDKIGNSNLTLIDDPTLDQAYSVSTFDAEGMPTRKNIFLDQGVLKQFSHSMYSAKRLGMKPNACAKRSGVASRPVSGMHAFYAQPTGQSVEELFESVGEAIYVQHLLGVHSGVNALSGDFSVGAQGVWIRQGAMAEAFKEATIASDLLTIMSNISAVANDTWWLPGSTVANTVLVDEMVLTGK